MFLYPRRFVIKGVVYFVGEFFIEVVILLNTKRRADGYKIHKNVFGKEFLPPFGGILFYYCVYLFKNKFFLFLQFP